MTGNPQAFARRVERVALSPDQIAFIAERSGVMSVLRAVSAFG